jgi:hypothetical protein
MTRAKPVLTFRTGSIWRYGSLPGFLLDRFQNSGLYAAAAARFTAAVLLPAEFPNFLMCPRQWELIESDLALRESLLPLLDAKKPRTIPGPCAGAQAGTSVVRDGWATPIEPVDQRGADGLNPRLKCDRSPIQSTGNETLR